MTSTYTPTPAFTRIPKPTRTPTPTKTRIPRSTYTPTPTKTISFFPTEVVPTTTIPTPLHSNTPTEIPTYIKPQIQSMPDIKIPLHQDRLRLLQLDNYVIDSDTAKDELIWNFQMQRGGPDVQIDSNRWLTITNVDRVGIFSSRISVADGQSMDTRLLKVKVSHFVLRPRFDPIILMPEELYTSSYSLFSQVEPPNFPRDQIRFEILKPYPEGVSHAEITSNGHILMKAGKNPPAKIQPLTIWAQYVSPTPTPRIVPTVLPAKTSTPTSLPTYTLTPTLTPTQNPTHIVSPLPTPIAKTDLFFPACDNAIHFAKRKIATLGSGPVELRSADVNRDGFPDFVSANFNEDNATLLLSQGHYMNHQSIRLDSGIGCLNALIDDMNGDGRLDIMLLGSLDSCVTYYANENWHSQDGRIVLDDWTKSHEDRNEIARVRLMASGRFFEGYHRILVVALDRYWYFFNIRSNGQFSQLNKMPAPAEAIQLAAMDVDLDGFDELAVTHNHPARLTLWKGNHRSFELWKQFSLEDEYPGNYSQNLITDPHTLILTTLGDTLNFLVSGRLPVMLQSISTNVQAVVRDMAAADFDMDGDSDLLWAGYDIQMERPAFTLFCGDPVNNWREHSTTAIPQTFVLNQNFSLDVTDFNRDGKPDIALADYSKNQLALYQNITPSK